jgi:hypothetical protein
MTGVDASVAMLAQARELYPSLTLHQDYLPDLTTLTENSFVITLRGTHQPDKRENGKLYEEINISELCQLFTSHQATVLSHEIDLEPKRQLTWHNLVIKK